jgi:hypothetical protein
VKIPLFEDSSGERSLTGTAFILTLGVILIKYLVAGIGIGKFSGGSYPDALLTTGLLTTVLGAYIARKNEIGVPAASKTQQAVKESPAVAKPLAVQVDVAEMKVTQTKKEKKP